MANLASVSMFWSVDLSSAFGVSMNRAGEKAQMVSGTAYNEEFLQTSCRSAYGMMWIRNRSMRRGLQDIRLAMSIMEKVERICGNQVRGC